MSYDIEQCAYVQCLKLILFSVASFLGEQEDPSRPLVTCISMKLGHFKLLLFKTLTFSCLKLNFSLGLDLKFNSSFSTLKF